MLQILSVTPFENMLASHQTDDLSLLELATVLGNALLGCGRALATAESCTGGWIAKVLTDIPGSSVWFPGGVVSYADAVKREVLGVSTQTLADHGAVSDATVEEMARGVLELCHADIAVAVSGIAGPGGGEGPGKPVGAVCFGWAWRDGNHTQVHTLRRQFAGDREAVRRASVAVALQETLRLVSQWSDDV